MDLRLLVQRLMVQLVETKTWQKIMYYVPTIVFSTKETDIDGRMYNDGYKHLKKGDIIATKRDHKLTTRVIGGKYSHVAVCVNVVVMGDVTMYEVAEMTRHGYTKSFFYDLCREADLVDIYRFTEDQAYIEEFIKNVKSFEHAVYDNKFKIDDFKTAVAMSINDGVKQKDIPELYCSELIYICDTSNKIKCNTEDLLLLGRKYVSPTELVRNIQLIWTSATAPKRELVVA